MVQTYKVGLHSRSHSLPLHRSVIAASLQRHCSVIAASLQLHCSFIAASLQLHCRCSFEQEPFKNRVLLRTEVHMTHSCSQFDLSISVCHDSFALTSMSHIGRLAGAMGLSHCKILQHTAAHCNTLQNTAKHCNTL